MKCPSCGMEVAAGRFCENCGAMLPTDEFAAAQPVQSQPATTSFGDAVPYDPMPQPVAETQPYGGAGTQGFGSQQTEAYGQYATQGHAPYGDQAGPQAGQYGAPQPTAQMPMYTSPAMNQASSAPFVLSIIALVTAILGLFPVSLVLAIVALVMNSGQKKRGEVSTKQTPAFVMGIISLILSILMAVFTMMVGGAIWLAAVSGELDDAITISKSPTTASVMNTVSADI